MHEKYILFACSEARSVDDSHHCSQCARCSISRLWTSVLYSYALSARIRRIKSGMRTAFLAQIAPNFIFLYFLRDAEFGRWNRTRTTRRTYTHWKSRIYTNVRAHCLLVYASEKINCRQNAAALAQHASLSCVVAFTSCAGFHFFTIANYPRRRSASVRFAAVLKLLPLCLDFSFASRLCTCLLIKFFFLILSAAFASGLRLSAQTWPSSLSTLRRTITLSRQVRDQWGCQIRNTKSTIDFQKIHRLSLIFIEER